MNESPATPEPVRPTSITDHRRVLRSMLDDLKTLLAAAEKLKLEDVRLRAVEVLDRTENQFFTVAIVGEFKRGKSTLINALLGKEVLPADVLPCSATLNRVSYGLKPSAKLVFRGKEGQPDTTQEISIDELREYVTKLTPESEVRAADIREAVVYYPTPYCRDKADIIDTPGLNDDENMTGVTLGVLPKIDAAIMVILAQSPFGQYEAEFLNNRMLMSDIGRVIFVVNRIDEIRRPEDRQRILQAVEDRIRKTVEARAEAIYGKDSAEYSMFLKRIGRPQVFGVSGAMALEAKESGNAQQLEDSGFARFEQRLEEFLTRDRGAVALQVLADCSVSSAAKILQQLTVREGALQMSAQQFQEASAKAQAKLQELQAKVQTAGRQVQEAGQKCFERLRPMLMGLEAEVLSAVGETVRAISITPADLDSKNQQRLMDRLGNVVSKAVQQKAQISMEKLQTQVEQDLFHTARELGGVANTVRMGLEEVRLQFVGPAAKGEGDAGQMLATAAGGLTATMGMGLVGWGLGGIWAGYREGGPKGAFIGGGAGAVAGFGASFGAAMVIALLGMPFAWPAYLAMGVVGGLASFVTGKKVARFVCSRDRIEELRTTFLKTTEQEIGGQIRAQVPQFEARLQTHVKESFEALKAHLSKELGGPITETQRTLDELNERQVRDSAQREMELRDLAATRKAAEQIYARAAARSNELRDVVSV